MSYGGSLHWWMFMYYYVIFRSLPISLWDNGEETWPLHSRKTQRISELLSNTYQVQTPMGFKQYGYTYMYVHSQYYGHIVCESDNVYSDYTCTCICLLYAYFVTVSHFLKLTFLSAVGSKFFGPKQFPFLALLPAEVWADIVVEEVGRALCSIFHAFWHLVQFQGQLIG